MFTGSCLATLDKTHKYEKNWGGGGGYGGIACSVNASFNTCC